MTAVQRRDRAAWVFLSPWLVGLVVLTLGPMIASLVLSFTDYDLFTPPQFIGAANYTRMLFDDPRFWASVGVTVNYVVVVVPLKIVVALAIALLLNTARRGAGVYRAAFYAPSLLGASVALAIVWRTLFETGGVVDETLARVGVDIGGWVSNPSLALWVLVSLAVWQFGAPMVIFLAGLQQIPSEFTDAAAVDGASRWRTFRSVTLPLLTPAVLFVLVIETVAASQAFTAAYIVSDGRGGPVDATLFFTLYLYERAFTAFEMGYASAMAWVLLAVTALVTALLFRTARRWVLYGDER